MWGITFKQIKTLGLFEKMQILHFLMGLFSPTRAFSGGFWQISLKRSLYVKNWKKSFLRPLFRATFPLNTDLNSSSGSPWDPTGGSWDPPGGSQGSQRRNWSWISTGKLLGPLFRQDADFPLPEVDGVEWDFWQKYVISVFHSVRHSISTLGNKCSHTLCSLNVFVSSLSLSLSLLLSFCWSRHVFSSLWSNVSKVKSLKDRSLVVL